MHLLGLFWTAGVIGTFLALFIVQRKLAFYQKLRHIWTIAFALCPAIYFAFWLENVSRNVSGQGGLAFVWLPGVITPYCFVHGFLTIFIASFFWKWSCNPKCDLP